MAITLQDYLNDVQRLLHDSTNRFYDVQELIDYINKARMITVQETACTRQLQTKDITVAQNLAEATYSFSSLVPGRQVIDVLEILVRYSDTTNYNLRFLPWEDITRTALWQSQLPGYCTHYTVYNRSALLFQYPAQAYPGSIWDCVLEPLKLANLADVDADIYEPYSECVPFYAAYLAKMKDQRRQDAESFMTDYQRRKIQAIGTAFYRRLVGR